MYTQQDILLFVANREEVMVKTNADGIEKVINSTGEYAFFMESSTIQYILERQCEVTQIGGELDTKVVLKAVNL